MDMDKDDLEEALARISAMEARLDKANELMDQLEDLLREYETYQPEIRILEEYYSSKTWKDDLALDEAGSLPHDLKRGVLSEDGIYNMLERNNELRRDRDQ